MKKEKFFITGGFGYIGTSFAKEAIKLGHEVLLYDSLIYEQDYIEIVNEIVGDHSSTNLQYIIGDTRNFNLLEDTVKSFSPTYFMHWGDFSSVYSCNHNPRLTDNVCFDASKKIVDLCEKYQIPLFYNSSSSVYGVQTKSIKMTEEDVLPLPTDNYCKVKLKMEEYIKYKISLNSTFKVIVFRPATVFGLSPRFRIELLPNHFSYMAVDQNVIMVADLNAYRSAIDVKDLVKGYFSVIKKGNWDKLIYNIGNHNFTKIEFALGIQKVTGCKIQTIPDIGDLRNLQINCDRFNNEFNFLPENTYQESIEDVVNLIQKNKKQIDDSNFSTMLNMPLSNWIKICK